MKKVMVRKSGHQFRMEEVSEPPGWGIIPQPPEFVPSFKRSERAVVTVATGIEASWMLKISRPFMEAYAKRVGADFIVLDWPGNPDFPISAKFMIPRVLDHYQRLAFLDADTLEVPGCVNLFEMCGEDEFGFVDELPHHRQNPIFGIETAYQAYRKVMAFNMVEEIPWYFNSGVMVVPASHKRVLEAPTGSMPFYHCAEQDHRNAMLLDSGLPYRMLDRRCNWQNWTDLGFKAAPKNAILHWSGSGGDRIARPEQMRRYAASLWS